MGKFNDDEYLENMCDKNDVKSTPLSPQLSKSLKNTTKIPILGAVCDGV